MQIPQQAIEEVLKLSGFKQFVGTEIADMRDIFRTVNQEKCVLISENERLNQLVEDLQNEVAAQTRRIKTEF